MEHFNPILGSEPNGQKFITCGEIMLRLTPPNYEKIRMASSFEASYGGSEANIALALANLGVDSTFFSVVPNNSLGKSAVRWLRSNDVHCTPMILTEPDETPSNRLGTYYLETGYGIRASKVIYDRKHSAITEYDFSQVDLDALLDGYDWLHLSGITPALGPNCRGLIIDMLKVAKKKDPFSLALQDGHLFFAPRFVPIKVDAHFADGNVGMVGRFEQALHVVERRFHLFRRVGQFRWVKPHHGAAEVGMLLTKLQHGANRCLVDVGKQNHFRPCLTGTGDDGFAVVVKFFRIRMAVRVDKHGLSFYVPRATACRQPVGQTFRRLRLHVSGLRWLRRRNG